MALCFNPSFSITQKEQIDCSVPEAKKGKVRACVGGIEVEKGRKKENVTLHLHLVI